MSEGADFLPASWGCLLRPFSQMRQRGRPTAARHCREVPLGVGMRSWLRPRLVCAAACLSVGWCLVTSTVAAFFCGTCSQKVADRVGLCDQRRIPPVTYHNRQPSASLSLIHISEPRD